MVYKFSNTFIKLPTDLFIQTLHPQVQVAVLPQGQVVNGPLKPAQDISQADSGVWARF